MKKQKNRQYIKTIKVLIAWFLASQEPKGVNRARQRLALEGETQKTQMCRVVY